MSFEQPKPTQAAGGEPVKRAYVRPEIVSRENLEVIAAVCSPPGKADVGSCPSGPITS